MKTRRVLLLIVAGSLTVALLLLFDFCGYEIDHHPQFDLVHAICDGTRGLITAIYLMAMWRLLESLSPPAERE